MAELVHTDAAADEGAFADGDIAAEKSAIGHDDMVADLAIMGDVRIGHHENVMADAGGRLG